MDNLTKEQRQVCMSHIKSKDTGIEILLRRAMWREGIRFRKDFKNLPGKPDVAITRYKIAVFCDSEFFHGKDFDQELRFRLEKGSNPDYWIPKIQRNIERDQEINCRLSQMGWIVLRFWGAEIRKDLPGCIQTVKDAILDRKTENINL